MIVFIVHSHSQTEKELTKLPKVECERCLPDIGAFYDLSAEAVRLNAVLMRLAGWSPQAAKTVNTGRVVVLRDGVSLRVWAARLTC